MRDVAWNPGDHGVGAGAGAGSEDGGSGVGDGPETGAVVVTGGDAAPVPVVPFGGVFDDAGFGGILTVPVGCEGAEGFPCDAVVVAGGAMVMTSSSVSSPFKLKKAATRRTTPTTARTMVWLNPLLVMFPHDSAGFWAAEECRHKPRPRRAGGLTVGLGPNLRTLSVRLECERCTDSVRIAGGGSLRMRGALGKIRTPKIGVESRQFIH